MINKALINFVQGCCIVLMQVLYVMGGVGNFQVSACFPFVSCLVTSKSVCKSYPKVATQMKYKSVQWSINATFVNTIP